MYQVHDNKTRKIIFEEHNLYAVLKFLESLGIPDSIIDYAIVAVVKEDSWSYSYEDEIDIEVFQDHS